MSTKKQQVWLAEYLKCWDATEAARRAGYKWPNKRGYQLTQELKNEIQQRIDALVMSADEVLIRLAEQARGSLADFSDVQLLTDLKNHPQAHLVKKLTSDVHETKDGKIHYKTHFELHDAQSALKLVGQHHNLFTQKIEHSGEISIDDSGLTDEDRANRIVTLLDRARERRNRPPDSGD